MVMLSLGDPAPWFVARTLARPGFQLAATAGRCVVLTFLESVAEARVHDAARALTAHAGLFDDQRACLFLVTNDRADEARLSERTPGARVILDYERALAALYGVSRPAPTRVSFVLDHALRVAAVVPFEPAETHAARVFAAAESIPAGPRERASVPAPILILPNVFEPEFCRSLIALYERHGGDDSGFARSDTSGKLATVVDYGFKRRRDHVIRDQAVLDAITARFQRRLFPEILKVFQFKVGAADSYLIARYDGGEGGYFRAHRDNAVPETAHRRFAASINLNADEYEGGDLRFPEYDTRTYRAPTGAAVVFSCSLLHEVRPVTRGRRYAVLPFLYDEANSAVPPPKVTAIP